MSRAPRITLACQSSDRTRPLLDGRVAIEGCDANIVAIDPEEIFHRAFRDQAFEACELSLASHLAHSSRDGSPYVGIPAFLSRSFRHSAVYVRTDRGIGSLGDLRGRRVGVSDYQQTAGMWLRGIMLDQHGVAAEEVTWVTGGLEETGRPARSALALGRAIPIEPAAERTLSQLLADGAIDAVFSPRVPSSVRDKRPNVGRLHADYRRVEEEYFRATGFFPIMHLVGVRRDVAAAHPWLPASLYKAFVQAKAIAMQDLAMTNYMRASLPWLHDELAAVRRLMGEDFWRYGVRENRVELAAACRYAERDGLAARLVEPEGLFHPSVLEPFKI